MLLADLNRRHEAGEAGERGSPQGPPESRAPDQPPRATTVSYGGSSSSASGFVGKGAARGSVAASVPGPPAQSAGSSGLVREAVLRAGSGDEVRHRMVRLRPAVRPPSVGGEDTGPETGGVSAAPAPGGGGIRLPTRWVQSLGRWRRMASGDPSASLRAWSAARSETASDATAVEADATAVEEATRESTSTCPPCTEQEPEGSREPEDSLSAEPIRPVLVCADVYNTESPTEEGDEAASSSGKRKVVLTARADVDKRRRVACQCRCSSEIEQGRRRVFVAPIEKVKRELWLIWPPNPTRQCQCTSARAAEGLAVGIRCPKK